MTTGGINNDHARQDKLLRDWLARPPADVPSNLKGYAAFISRQLIPRRYRLPIRAALTRCIGPVQRARLQRTVRQLEGQHEPVLLHVGCGTEHKDGFINIDLVGARGLDVALDLSKGVPLPDGSVDGVYHEHVLEHLPIRTGYAFLQECLRLLKPDGVLRVAVPDAGACIDAYVAGQPSPWTRDNPLPLMQVEWLFYDYTHVAMYDEQKLTSILRVAGFRDVVRRPFAETELPVAPDTERRRDTTLYVEGVR